MKQGIRKTLSNLVILTITCMLLFPVSGCNRQDASIRNEQIVTAIAADLDYLNPLLIQLSLSREVCALLYPTLMKAEYDATEGGMRFKPNAAKSWNFQDNGKSCTFNLRSDIRWEDGTPVTSRDFSYSYRLYADPAIASSRQHYLNDLLLTSDNKPDFDNAIETPTDSTLVIHFNKPMAEEIVLDHFNDLIPVAAHHYKKLKPEEIRRNASSMPILAAGPYKVKQWIRQQKLELVSNPASRLPRPATTQTMTFLVVPEYTTRLTMLKAGAIDVMISAGGINPKDIPDLQRTAPDVVVKPVKNRYFDSIVWLAIDGERYRNGKQIAPHPLFGDAAVRRALTLAIDRQSIIDGFMGPEHATIVNTSLSPAYRNIADTTLDPYAYNPEKAISILNNAGWVPGTDGILQKNGRRFSFELAAPVGNPRRNYAATIIQQNLRQIGIDCRIRIDEGLIFNKNQNEYRYDAALSGMAAETLPFQLVIWGSDFATRPFNSAAFQNRELDTVIARLATPLPEPQRKALWKQYQQILHDEQPRTFLYYYDELEGFSKSVQNARVTLVSTLQNAYEWKKK